MKQRCSVSALREPQPWSRKQPDVGVGDGFWVSWLAEKGAVTSSQAAGHTGKDGEQLGWALS